MGEVIQFPILVSEDDFLKKLKVDDIPPELVACLKSAYKNVIDKANSAPSVEVKVYQEYIKDMENFKLEYGNFVKSMFETLLTKEAEICLLKFELSKFRRVP